MDNNINIRPATNSDIKKIIKLLHDNGLPTIDIGISQVNFFIGEYQKQLVGVIGIEKYESKGLLRSLVVESSYTKLEIGKTLINQLFKYSKLNNIKDVYLLTETARMYFEKFRFEEIERTRVPEIIMKTSEFNDICPKSAVVMHKKL